MLVSTVTPMTSGGGTPVAAAASAAARAAACIIAGPPDACTLIIQAPVRTAASTACATVFGMSWNLRSRNTRAPESTRRRTRSGPAIVNSRLPTFRPPATPPTCSAMASARSAPSTSRATRSGLPGLVRIDAYRLLDSREPVACHPRGEPGQDLLHHSWSFVNQRGIDLDQRGPRSDPLVGIGRGEDPADADDGYWFSEVAEKQSTRRRCRGLVRSAAQSSGLFRRRAASQVRSRDSGIRGDEPRGAALDGCIRRADELVVGRVG